MKLISHRGNIDNVLPHRENTHEYIQEAIDAGYDVEIDVRCMSDNRLYLGHDNPDHEVTLQWLRDRKDRLWVHTKNFDALSYLIDTDLRIFYHQHEDHTIIHNCNLIWSHRLVEANQKSIIPLISLEDVKESGDEWMEQDVYGICSDYVGLLK